MANIYKYKTASGTRFYVKINRHNMQITKRGFITRESALLFLARFYESSQDIIKGDFALKDLNDKYITYIYNNVKITTAYNKKLLLKKYIFPFFENYKLNSINTSDIELFAMKINQSNYSDKKRIFWLTKEYLNYLKAYGLTNINTTCLSAPYDSNARSSHYDYYTREEFNKFLSVIDSSMYRLLFLLLFNYGLRIGEALGLRHKDITPSRLFIEGCITNKIGQGKQMYISTKTKSSRRDYPMLDCIYEAYKKYISELESRKSTDFIFKRSNDHFTIGFTPIRFAQKKYEELSGLRHIKLHEFRHSCATELINNGFQPDQVAAWLGHSSSNVTTRVYAHLFPSRKMAIANYYNEQKSYHCEKKTSQNFSRKNKKSR